MTGAIHIATRTGESVGPEIAPPKSRAGLLAAAVLVASAVAWNVVVRVILENRAAARDEQAITTAASLFRTRVSWSQEKLEALSELIAEDPRLKATLATPEERTAITDVLVELQHKLGTAIIAVAGVDGVVISCAGEERLVGMDLGTSPLIAEATDASDARSSVWGFESRLLSVSARAVRLGGSKQLGVVLLAQEVDEQLFAEIRRVAGTESALAIADKTTLMTDPTAAAAFDRAKGFTGGATAVFNIDGERFVSLAEDVSERPLPARALWLRRSEAPRDRTAQFLLWLPAIAAAVFGVRVAWKSKSGERP